MALAVPVQAGKKPEIRIVETGYRPFVVSAPEHGAVLSAGALAEVAWEPRSGFEAIEKAEEWEAYLSVNGGRTYPLRVTPHLDLGIRRFRWTVPNLPTPDARLLLRFGDERLETGFELPLRFSIAASREGFDLEPTALSLERGESALPGDEGVVSWVEGTRDGGSLRRVTAAVPRGIRPLVEMPWGHLLQVDFAPQSAGGARLLAPSAVRLSSDLTSAALWSVSSVRCGPPPDLLLLHCRRNE